MKFIPSLLLFVLAENIIGFVECEKRDCYPIRYNGVNVTTNPEYTNGNVSLKNPTSLDINMRFHKTINNFNIKVDLYRLYSNRLFSFASVDTDICSKPKLKAYRAVASYLLKYVERHLNYTLHCPVLPFLINVRDMYMGFEPLPRKILYKNDAKYVVNALLYEKMKETVVDVLKASFCFSIAKIC